VAAKNSEKPGLTAGQACYINEDKTKQTQQKEENK
jgi:hypothetical protein